MLEAFKNALPQLFGRRRVPLNAGEFWSKHGSDIMALQSKIDRIRQKRISVVSQSDESFTQGAPKPKNEFIYAQKYANTLWVHVAVKSIMTACSMLELKTYKTRQTVDGAELIEDTNNLGYRLFNRPSLYVTSANLKRVLFGSYLYAGNSYLYVDPESEELWPLLPQHVSIVADRIDFIEKYKFKVDDLSINYDMPPEQVIHTKDFNSTGYLYGLSPLSAAYPQATLIDSDVKYWQTFWQHGGRVMGAWSVENALSDAQFERFDTQIKNKYKGLENMFKDILLEAGVKYEQLGVNQSDAKLIEKYKLSRDDILAAYGVPSSIAGVLDQANYSNMDVQERLFWQNTVLPTLTMVEESLNSNLILTENKSIKFKFDTSKVRVLQQIDKEKAEFGGILIDKKQMTPNEVRQRLWNLPPIPGDGDILGNDSPQPVLQPRSIDKAMNDVDEILGGKEVNTPRPPKQSRINADDKIEMAKAFDDALIKHDRDVLKFVRKRFKEQKETVLKNLRAILKDEGDRTIRRSDVTKLLDGVTDGQDAFAQGLRTRLTDVAVEFGNRAVDSLKSQLKKSIKNFRTKKPRKIEFNPNDPTVARYLRDRTIEVAGTTDEFTLSMFREGMISQMEDDASITAVSKYVDDFFGGMDKWRALRIARTETGSAASKAMDQTFRMNADIIEQKEWVNANDEFVRDSHKNVEPVDVNDDFTLHDPKDGDVRASAPGNSGVASQDINCRCMLVAVVKEGTTAEEEGI